MAKITLWSAMKNLGRLEDPNLESDTSYMGTERGVLSVVRFCYVFPCELGGPAWAVGSCSISQSAGELPKTIIFKTLDTPLCTYNIIPPSRLSPSPLLPSCTNLAGPGTGPGTRPGIPAPPFFDGYPRTTRPRESPTMRTLIRALDRKTRKRANLPQLG